MRFKVIAGLGNPGRQYEKSRHNLGWMALDAFADQQNAESWKLEKKFEAEVSTVFLNGEKLSLLKPQTFMNHSGRSIGKFLDYHKLSADDLLLIYDDIDLDFQKMRIANNGGTGGHNGVKSTVEALGTKQFTRLKLGVKTNKRDRVPADRFVLERFGLFEKHKVNKWLPQITDAINCLLQEDEQVCMNRFH